jgi:hypothetical protein
MEENRQIHEDYREFRSLYFEKMETKRLIKMQERDI